MNFSIVRPEAGTNRFTNPSLETAATGYAAGTSSTVTRSTDYAAFGSAALKLVGAATNANAYAPLTRGANDDVTFSCYARSSTGTVNARLYIAADDFSAQVNGTTTTLTTRWKRLTLTSLDAALDALHGGGTSLNLALQITDASGTIYGDGFQFESVAYVTTYMDGDQPGCRWTGTPHASTSTRDAQSREGGRAITIYLAGGTANYAQGVPSSAGLGMMPVNVIGTALSQIGGELPQRTLRQRRIITLNLSFNGSTLDDMHAKRQNFIDLIKPDLVFPEQPFLLRYYNDDAAAYGKVLRARCQYESGMDWTWSKPQGPNMDCPVRMPALDPLWYEEIDSSAVLGYSSSISNANYILQRDSTGAWAAMGTGGSPGSGRAVSCLLTMPNGDIIAGGNFDSMGGVSNTGGIARWNGSAWLALGTGVSGSQNVSALAVDAAGNLYAGGSFTSMGGVSNTKYIAKWNGSAWSSISSGCTGSSILSLAVGFDGLIYAGGIFSVLGGTTAANIASYNGSAWSALSSGLGTGGSNSVNALAVGPGGSLIATGDFTAPYTKIAKWNGSAWSGLSSGITAGDGIALAFGLDGTLYVGGTFTGAGGITAYSIARWNGTAWQPLGSGVNSVVYSLAVASDGTLYAGGDFSTAGGVTLTDHFARWNGATWVLPDIDLPGNAVVYAILSRPDKSLTVGYNTTGTATGATVTAAAVTAGTAAVAPKVYLTGPGAFISLTNRTTGKQIQFNGLTLLAGETAVLDLTPGNGSFLSSFRGSLMSYLQSAPQIADWSLLPGANNIAAYITGGTAATALALVYRAAHWSADAAGI